ncbi:MAG TPA: oxalate/formate MFS antiporter [Steroidobacteraceae bacterium]|jgi:OFA family oxalate/formate antiporter-like MFS transporter
MVADSNSKSIFAHPWIQLILGLICMASVANLQYGWTLFVNPIDAQFHWGRPAIQVAFTLFVLIETWLVPVEGYLVDRFGPRPVVIAGGILVAIAWSINSVADSLALLYFGAVLGGIGTGSVYGTCVGNALKWFPGRRGLAAGITAAGFGAGAALTIVPISKMISSDGYQHAFLFFGILQGVIVFVVAWGLMVAPKSLQTAAPRPTLSARSFTPTEVLRTPCFYVMYVMFVLVAAGGLMMAASMAPIAKDLKIDKIPVALFGVTMAALAFALMLNRIFDGVGRPFFGWVSDNIGRENTMAIAFLIGAGALFTLSQAGANPPVFVLVTAIYFGVFGEIYSLFPATQGDTFGAQYAAANAGLLYTAKGAGALLVAPATALALSMGWHTVFMIAMSFNIVAALIGLIVLKPMRARHLADTRAHIDAAALAARSPMQPAGN